MTIYYFPDTDTFLITFNDHPVVETHEIMEHLLIDIDAHAQVVSVTVEHARQHTNLDPAGSAEHLHPAAGPESHPGSPRGSPILRAGMGVGA